MHRSFTSFGTASKSTNSYLYRNSTTNNWISMIANHLQEKRERCSISSLMITLVVLSDKKQIIFYTFYIPCLSSACRFICSRKKCCGFVQLHYSVQNMNVEAAPAFWWNFRATLSLWHPILKQLLIIRVFFHCVNIYVLLTLADSK